MVRKSNPSSKTLIAAFVAAAFGVSAGAALAQTTTSDNARDVAAADSPAARDVTLTNQHSAQTLRYTRARNLRICNLTGHRQSVAARINSEETRSPEDFKTIGTQGAAPPPTPVPLQVSYGTKQEQIQPGNCFEFRASSVRLSPGRTLPPSGELYVSILPVSARGFVDGRTVAAASHNYETASGTYAGTSGAGATSWDTTARDRTGRERAANNASSHETVQQLTEQLKRDDQQEREANAELRRARAKLAQTTRDLKQAQAEERHVASAERKTAQAEHEEQQSAGASRHNDEQSQQNAEQSQQNEGTPR